MRHSTLPGILARSLALEDQIRAFTSWQQESLRLTEDLDILDLINEQANAFKSALMSLQTVHDRLSNNHQRFDDVVAELERRYSINFSEEVASVKDVFVELNKAGAELGKPSSNRAAGKTSRSRQKEAISSFEKLYEQLKPHLGVIETLARKLRDASRTESDVFLKEYDALERMHSKEVLKRLRLCFSRNPFAVTVSLDSKRGQTEEEGCDDADMIYEYLDKEKGVETFLRHFNEMGSKWPAQMLGGSSPPEIRKLEMAYTKLSCGVIDALQQSVLHDEGISPLLVEMTKYLDCRLGKWEELTCRQKIIIAIGGHFSHGKSSFLNALMGEDVLPTNSESTWHGETEADDTPPRDTHDCNTLPYSAQSCSWTYARNTTTGAISGPFEEIDRLCIITHGQRHSG